jgi:hypothetical protein
MSAPAAPFPVHREDLGPFEHTYGSGSISAVRVFAYLASALAFGLGVFFLKLNQDISANSEIQDLPKLAALLVFSLSFVCLLGGMLHKPKSKRVLLFENGLAFEDTTKAQTASWEEILHYQSCASGEPFRFSLTNGTEISIPKETAGFIDLCNAIRIRAGEHIFQREYALIKSGGKSEFGPLAFSLDGFSIDGMQIDWPELNQVSNSATKGSERLIFETHALAELGPSVPANKIPSAQVCYRLIEQLAQIRVLSAL